jgi:GWxTD domain-containing protein
LHFLPVSPQHFRPPKKEFAVFKKPHLRFVPVLFLSLAFAVQLQAQQTGTTKQVSQPQESQNPADRDRKVKAEPDNAYKRWLNEDVALIITADERRAFEKLTTNEEREQFIKIFWDNRDPSPDTEENEYREAHYERIAYANEHFSSGKPGVMTDRGRIYVKFGKPDEIESHPAGGLYQRTSAEGGGSTTTYPFERWFYRYLPGVGSGIEIEFVDSTGSGEYRLALDSEAKNALAHVPGYAPANTTSGSFVRPEESLLGKIELLADLEKAPELERRLNERTPSPIQDNDPLNFDLRADFFKLADNRVITAFTMQTDNKDLVFQDRGGLQTARLNIYGKIVGVTERRLGSFEDSLTTTVMTAELAEALTRRSAYSKVTVLAPGTYRIDVMVRDIASGATGVRHFGFQVPKYDNSKLSTSSMILAAKLEKVEDAPTYGQFVIGETKVIPNLTGIYHRGQPVGVYLQLYNAGIDQTTLRPSVDVAYVLLKDGKELMRQPEDWRGVSETPNRVVLTRLLDTKTLAPGDYEVAIQVQDRVLGQSLRQSAKFTLVP